MHPFIFKRRRRSHSPLLRRLERMADLMAKISVVPQESKYTIKKCLEILEKMGGIEEGDKLWMYATRLFLKPSNRELFVCLAKDETRLKWLKAHEEMDFLSDSESSEDLDDIRSSDEEKQELESSLKVSERKNLVLSAIAVGAMALCQECLRKT